MDMVGGIPTPLKNMKVNWDDYSRYMEKLKNVPNHQPVLDGPSVVFLPVRGYIFMFTDMFMILL